jgi:hypothetical protein
MYWREPGGDAIMLDPVSVPFAESMEMMKPEQLDGLETMDPKPMSPRKEPACVNRYQTRPRQSERRSRCPISITPHSCLLGVHQRKTTILVQRQ